MKFYGTKKWSPIINEGIPPRDSIYWESFWNDNRRYIIDGYTTGDERITGDHYWYLNFWKIRGLNPATGRKEIIYPRFLDLDYEVWHVIERARDIEKKNVLFLKARQKGFDLPNSEPVLTVSGWKNNGKIKIGDYIATRHSTFTPVIGVYPQGKKDVYEMTLMDGRKVRCGINHLWKVWDVDIKRERVLKTEDLLDYGLYHIINKGRNKAYRFKIPDIEPIPFNKKELFIHPYLLGLLIGDGSINAQLRLSSNDLETVDYVKEILGNDYSLVRDETTYNYNINFNGYHNQALKDRFNLARNVNKFNPLLQEFNRLGLRWKRSHNKFIPDEYKYSSIEQRVELIRGLMDSDGYVSDAGCMEFKTVSGRLADDVSEVLRSLGVKVSVSSFENGIQRKFYRLYLKTTSFNPFHLRRKAIRFKKDKDIYRRVSIIDIRPLGYKEESTCIEVSDIDHIYLTKDFIPTHNTEKLAALGGKEFTFFRGSQTVYVAGLEFYSNMIMNSTVRGLNDLYDTEFYKRRFPDRDDYMKAQFSDTIVDEHGNETVVWKGYMSEMYKITAKNNPQAVSSRSPSLIVFEEVGIFPGAIATYGFVEPSLISEGKMTGFAVFIGTGGDMETGAAEFEKMFYSPDEFNILSFDLSKFDDTVPRGNKRVGYFVPAWKYRIIDADGNSLKEESIKNIQKERKKSEGTITEYQKIITNPLYPHEAFMTSQAGFFGRKIVTMLHKRKVQIYQHPEETADNEWGDLEWVYNKDGIIEDIKWNPDGQKKFLIMEHPEFRLMDTKPIEGQYKGATDSYDKDEANTSTSQGSTHIYKDFVDANHTSGYFTARLIERPDEAEEFYEDSAKLCYYYSAMNLIEWSNVRIFDWYKRNGFEFMLRERPEFVLSTWIIKSKVENRYGIDPSTKIHWLGLLKKLLLIPGFIDKMKDIDQINAFIHYVLKKGYNCDITISSALCAVQIEEEKLQVIETTPVNKSNWKPGLNYSLIGNKIIAQ